MRLNTPSGLPLLHVHGKRTAKYRECKTVPLTCARQPTKRNSESAWRDRTTSSPSKASLRMSPCSEKQTKIAVFLDFVDERTGPLYAQTVVKRIFDEGHHVAIFGKSMLPSITALRLRFSLFVCSSWTTGKLRTRSGDSKNNTDRGDIDRHRWEPVTPQLEEIVLKNHWFTWWPFRLTSSHAVCSFVPPCPDSPTQYCLSAFLLDSQQIILNWMILFKHMSLYDYKLMWGKRTANSKVQWHDGSPIFLVCCFFENNIKSSPFDTSLSVLCWAVPTLPVISCSCPK